MTLKGTFLYRRFMDACDRVSEKNKQYAEPIKKLKTIVDKPSYYGEPSSKKEVFMGAWLAVVESNIDMGLKNALCTSILYDQCAFGAIPPCWKSGNTSVAMMNLLRKNFDVSGVPDIEVQAEIATAFKI